MDEMPDILWLEEIRKEDISAVGGKGASLGEMSSIGLPVPGGFVVTSRAFRHFLIEAGIEQTLFADLEDLNVDDNPALERASKKARAAVMKAKMPASLKDRIREAYLKLEGGGMVVAVRSSATAEDLPDASFAGQQETYLNIKGEKSLLEAVQKCWASLYGATGTLLSRETGI